MLLSCSETLCAVSLLCHSTNSLFHSFCSEVLPVCVQYEARAVRAYCFVFRILWLVCF